MRPQDACDTHLHYLVDDSGKISAFKSSLQTSHLIQDAAQSPDITLGIVWLAFTLDGEEIE